jgi:hypothetical protein
MTATSGWKAQMHAAVKQARQARRTRGERPLRALDVARRLMAEVGSVVVGFGPDAAEFPNTGDSLSIFGGKMLPDGYSLHVQGRTNVNAWISQIARISGADVAGSYPRPNGSRYFRCVLVEGKSK